MPNDLAFTTDPTMRHFFGNNAVMDAVDDIPVPTKEDSGDAPVTPIEDITHPAITPDNVDITIDIARDEDGASYIIHDPDSAEQMAFDRKRCMEYLDYCQRLVNNYYEGRIGQEGFLDGIKNAVAGIGNIFGHFLNLFYTQVVYGLRDFKRSELTAYIDSNKITWQRIKATDYYAYFKVTVPAPKGMVGKYRPALTALEDFLNKLQMRKATKQMVTSAGRITKEIQRGSGMSAMVAPLMQDFFPKDLRKNFDAMDRIFTDGGPREDDKVEDLFDNAEDFKYVINKCQDDDSFFREVAGVHMDLQNVHYWIKKIAEMEVKIDPTVMDRLISIVRSWAEVFDMYAITIDDLQRVNHNLMWVVKEVRQGLNY